MAQDLPQTLSSQIAFSGPVFRVRIDELRYDDASAHRCDVVEHAGSFGIIALSAPGEIVLVRQYRHPVRRFLWEIPAGTADGAEEPIDGALRELAEETGYRAGRIRPLCTVFMTPGFCDEIMHFFVAEDLRSGTQSLDDDERIEVGRFTLERARDLLAAGDIADVKTLLALQWMTCGEGELGCGTVDRRD
ncbi:MAG: NUDIX hydrolase [Candidatus Tyrphobacter sp.]